jgi:hypothetical protein
MLRAIVGCDGARAVGVSDYGNGLEGVVRLHFLLHRDTSGWCRWLQGPRRIPWG